MKTNRIDFILLREVQTNFLMLRIIIETQNDVGMTSQFVYFRFLSLFCNNFTKIRYKFDEITSFSRKIVINVIRTTILAVWSFLLLLPWQQYTNLKFAIRFEKSFVKQT